MGRYTQGRRYERLTQAEYDTEVPEKTRKEWAENIVRKEWGLEILIEGGMAANKAEAKEVSPARVRELMDRVSGFHYAFPSIGGLLTEHCCFSFSPTTTLVRSYASSGGILSSTTMTTTFTRRLKPKARRLGGPPNLTTESMQWVTKPLLKWQA